jgi:hypothetical protein
VELIFRRRTTTSTSPFVHMPTGQTSVGSSPALNYATGNIHRGSKQFTGRALVTLGLAAAVVAYTCASW